MDLHVHRKIIAIITAMFMLVTLQVPAAFALEEDAPVAEETKQTEQTEATQPPAEETEQTQQTEAAQPQSDESTQSDSDKQDEAKTIDVKFSIVIDQQPAPLEWIPECKLSVKEKTTVETLLKDTLKEVEFTCSISEDGRLISITSSPAGGNYCLKNGDLGEHKGWTYRINDQKSDKLMRDQELKDGDKVVIKYTELSAEELAAGEPAEETAENTEEQTEEPAEEASMSELAMAQLGAGSTPKEIADAYGNTKDKMTDLADSVNWAADSTWIVLALARGGSLTEEQAQAYLNSVAAETENSGSAMINKNQSSDNAKAIMALTAAGIDPTDVNGYNLLEPLANIAYVRAQGVNGPIWALLAFDSKGYEIPALDVGDPDTAAKFQTTRENLVSTLLNSRKSDGGWAYSGSSSDVDMTCMAIQALAPYYKKDMKVTIGGKEVSVKAAVDSALAWLSKQQHKDGSFSSVGVVTSESASQVIVALTSLGIDPAKDPRFLKNGKGAIDSLMSFYVKGGGFKHVDSNYKWNALASSQAFYALVSYYRSKDGKNSLYDMTDSGDGYKIDPSYDPQEEGGTDPEQDPEDVPKPEGKAKGLTKSGGLIKLKGDLTKKASASVDLIQKVVQRNLPKDAKKYTKDDIKAIGDAYKEYNKLTPAEKLAVRKNKFWKPYSKIIAKLGKVYHLDEKSGIDMRSNDDSALPWYIKLIINEKQMDQEETEKIEGLLGESSSLFTMYDVHFENSLTGKEWHPKKIVKVGLPIPEEVSGEAIAVHITDENKIEFINGEAEEGMLLIRAADFSAYGIASMTGSISDLMKTQQDEEPVSILPWILGGAGALAALLILLIARRKMTDEE
ncbi:MAG: DUF4430 domain-containing protein [Bacillota bacterium]|nr:DUF4430 domain-containing protein [Bacillota bacterium]